jgi:hypothetical protein
MKEEIRVVVRERDGTISYHIRKDGFTSSEAFDRTFYEEIEGEYVRKYPATLMFGHDLPGLERRYGAFVNREYSEGKTAEAVDRVLEWICDTHEAHGIRWWLTGSAALYVRGIDLLPHDVDVMTYLTEIEKVRAAVWDHIVEPFHHVRGWVVKGFGVIDYGYRVDYAFEPEEYVDGRGLCDFGPYAEAHLEEIVWHGRKIRVPEIRLHLRPNQVRNRTQVVQAIEDYLARNAKA